MKIRGKTMYRNVILSVILLLSAAAAATVDTGLLVERHLLAPAGLEPAWQVNLPMRAAEKIDRLFVFDAYLYALTNHNYLYVIDIEKQAFRFGVQMALRGLPVSSPLSRDGQVWFMVGSDLVAVDPKAGGIAFKKNLKQLGRTALGAMDANRYRLYVPSSDMRLHSINLDGYWQDFMVAADDGAQINSVTADDEYVVLTTESGHVISIWPDQAKKRWAYDVVGRITAPIVSEDEWLYVSSENTKLYKLSVRTGRGAWTDAFHAGEPLTKSVVLGKNVVYQSADDKGVYAVDKQTGKSVWHLPAGVDVIVEIGDLAYVYARPGLLAVMDNAKGGQLCSVNFATVEKYAINTTDASLYVADLQGRVMCIKQKNQ